MTLQTRNNELTAVLHRSKFDEPPGDLRDSRDLERWRLFRTRYHLASALEHVYDFPLQIDFELAYSCNFGCSFCPHGNPTSPQPTKWSRLSFEDFASVIEQCKSHGLCSIKLNYINEPLLIKDLPDYISHAKSNGVLNVYFATNGALLSRQVAEDLILARTSKVMVSLDAATPETFKLMRHSDKFQTIVDNIKRLISIRNEYGVRYPLVRVNFVRTALNQHEEQLFLRQWDGIADMVGVESQVALPGVDNQNIMLRPNLEDFGCSFPFKLVVVDSERNILPCCTFSGREMPIGNIQTDTIWQAWNSEKMVALRALHKARKWASNPVCKHCLGCA